MLRRLLIASLLVSVVGCTAVRAATVPFAPLSFTAVDERDYWVLGAAGVLHTTDGGAHFTTLPAPPFDGAPGVTEFLRFADARDGYAFVPRGSFAVTHDGGHTWRLEHLGAPAAFATGGGLVHVVVARGASYRLATSPVGVDAWRYSRLPFRAEAGSPVDLSAHGRHLWLLGAVATHEVLARSDDGGTRWRVGPAPCVPGLGGQLLPVSTSVVWADCPTGMMARAWRSADGGATFSLLRGVEMVNSAQLAPASASTALLARNGAGARPLRTTDGGRTWRRVRVPAVPVDVEWAGFTDARVGAAIVATPNGTRLWRTTDAGASWSLVRLP